MTWRIVVIARRAKLELKLNYMVVRGETVKKIHIGEISTVIIESTEVSLTAALLAELIKQKIKVVFCDEKRNPSAELLAYYGCHDSSSKIRQQIGWNENIKGMVWTDVVTKKITQQQNLLVALGKQEANLLHSYIEQIEYRDVTNREGHAAKVYFNALFGKDFVRSSDNLINAALNYGYAIMLGACNREITANGYLTQLGLFHDNTFNSFNLGSDIMEPLRPFVDECVYREYFAERLEKFEHEEKMTILNLLNNEVFFDGKKNFLNYGIKLYCKSIFTALNDRDTALIHYCLPLKWSCKNGI